MLTESAARDLGRKLRFLRHSRSATLRDVARKGGLSAQYVQNLERGERTNPSEELLGRLPRAYEIPEIVVTDLMLKARIESALEKRGLEADQREFVWRGVAQRMDELGLTPQTDVARVASEIIGR